MEKTIYYFSGTHWDREWYQTYHGFRYRLVKMMDGLVNTMENNKDFGVFHLDGQTIVLEDYAEIEPENAEKLKKYIAENRVKVGPWYVMPDEFLLSGESLIRNLMIGHRLSKKWGASEAWKFGYVCDIFGHIAQMPQIFNGFDIKYSLQCRGNYSDKTPYVIWQSPDGSECLNFSMGKGYGDFCLAVIDNIRGLSINTPEQAKPRLGKYLEDLFGRTDIPVYVIMDALDHMPVHDDTPEYIEMIKDAVPDARVLHVDLLQAGRQLEEYRSRLDVVKGELNKTNIGEFHDVISNTLSSYYTHKKSNDMCQNRLEKVIEPMLVYAAVNGNALNRRYLKLAYKYLIQNHPHDSICGCSIDQVHKDMRYRFDQVNEICDVLESNFMIENSRTYFYTEEEETNGVLTLINTLPHDREEVINVDLRMKPTFPRHYSEQAFGYETLNSFLILDCEGKEIPYQVTAVKRAQTVTIKDQYTKPADIYSVTFKAFVPAGGKSEYRIVPFEKASRYLKHMKSGVDYMENDFIRVSINPNGTVSILDKNTNKVYDNQLRLVDDSEIGDGWFHAGAKEERTVYSGFEPCGVEKIESGCSRCVFRITKTLRLPKRLEATAVTQVRSGDYDTCTVTFDVGLSENERYADIKMVIDNRNIKDHRLRLIMPTYTDSDSYFAGQAFYCCNRRAGIDFETQTWREYDQYEKAMNGIVGRRSADGSGLAFISAYGLHECAALTDEEASVYITLLRGFRRTVQTNGEVKGQLNTTLSYHYILAPIDDSVQYADLVRIQDKLAAPVLSGYSEIKPSESIFKPESGFKLAGDGICLSILKCAEDEDSFVARVYNASDAPSAAVMEFPFAPSEAFSVNLNEEAETHNKAELAANTVRMELKPWQIGTVMVRR